MYTTSETLLLCVTITETRKHAPTTHCCVQTPDGGCFIYMPEDSKLCTWAHTQPQSLHRLLRIAVNSQVRKLFQLLAHTQTHTAHQWFVSQAICGDSYSQRLVNRKRNWQREAIVNTPELFYPDLSFVRYACRKTQQAACTSHTELLAETHDPQLRQ